MIVATNPGYVLLVAYFYPRRFIHPTTNGEQYILLNYQLQIYSLRQQ